MAESARAQSVGCPGESETRPASGPAASRERSTVAVRSVQAVAGEVEPTATQPPEVQPLSDSISQLSGAFGEIRALLGRSVQINAALEIDLGAARQKAADAIREREKLLQRVDQYEKRAALVEETRGRLEQVCGQRETLAAKIQEMSNALSASEHGMHELGRRLQHCGAERDEASEKSRCLESQFERAVKVIEELRREISASRKREQELQSGVQELQARVDVLLPQRDKLRRELSEAREAMEYIRQSILAAGRGSQGGLFEG